MSSLPFPDPWLTALNLGMAVALGALVGLERETGGRPAGFRTHILVCVGSCLLMMLSAALAADRFDPARLAAGIITGMGFLGAGTIIRHGSAVRGLTTAASLWAMTGVGLAIALGWYFGAIAGTLAIYVTLTFLKTLEQRLGSPKRKMAFWVTMDTEARLGPVLRGARELGMWLRAARVDEHESGEAVRARLSFDAPPGVEPAEVASQLVRLEGVSDVEVA